ncbi:MAG: response regulator, partial [Rubrivivax sp.]
MRTAGLGSLPLTGTAVGSGQPPCLLLVDDQPLNIQALYRVFAEDHRVLMATSGERALALCGQTPPDMVLLDVMMPGMDGHEVARRLRGDPATSGIPIIFVTARDDAEDEARGLALGAVDFIAKPINPAVVRARVRTHLELARARALGFEFRTGVEPEFFLLAASGDAIADAADRQSKPCYDQLALMRHYPLISAVVESMEQLGWGPYQADHEDANG